MTTRRTVPGSALSMLSGVVFLTGVALFGANEGCRRDASTVLAAPDTVPSPSGSSKVVEPEENEAPVASAAPVISPSVPAIAPDQTAALKRCQQHNLDALKKNAGKVATFCKQGGCRVIGEPAQIYEQLLWCGKDNQGVWGLSMTQVQLPTKNKTEPDPNEVRLSGTLAVSRYTARVDGTVSEVENAGWSGLDFSVDWFSTVELTRKLSDLDGDNVSELLVRRVASVEESPENGSSLVTAFRFRAGAIEAIPEVLALKPMAFTDADKDGRIDFILRSPFVAIFPCISECSFAGPELLAHTLPDGRLDSNDSVAVDYVRRQCNEPRDTADAPMAEWIDIACDKFAGVGETAIKQRLEASAWAAVIDPNYRKKNIQSWANAPVPFIVPGLKASRPGHH
ncbi:MAG: hypothetical protein U0165_03640 [Polyangiaceae bacterium]